MSMLNKSQIEQLQKACNQGIRAVAGIAKRGQQSITAIRSQLGIQSVQELITSTFLLHGWTLKPTDPLHNGPSTRAKSKMNTRIEGSVKYETSKTRAQRAWNMLPTRIRLETDKKKAKSMIKLLVK